MTRSLLAERREVEFVGQDWYLPCFVIIISVPKVWKDFQRSAFSRVILMESCWYESAAGGDRVILRLDLFCRENTHVNNSAKSDVFIKHVADS